MDTARDLACPALWQESLERSLARRGRPTRSSLELSHLRAERDLSRPELLRESLMYSQLRRSAVSRRPSMAVPGAGGISALALLAATTLPGLLGGGRAGGHRVVGYRADASDARLANSPVAGLATDPSLAAKATAATTTTATGPVTAVTAPAEPSHVVATRTVAAPHKSAPSASATRRAPRHPQLAHIAADHGASKPVAHALSGGAAPVAPKLVAAAPRVPADPQPIGHPRTGGGALNAASHTRTPAQAPQAPTHSVGPAQPTHSAGAAQPTHPVGPATPTHSVGAAHPTHSAGPASPAHSGGAAAPTDSAPVAASHPKPVTTTHPVSTAKPAPKAPPPAAPGHYVNPLADANLTPERIDQGVDYSGSGTLGAIGNGKVTYVGTSGTGWPGAFVEYQLTDGADAGRYVFYAESISPVAGLHVGQIVRAGQPIASIHGGIEIGWASGVGTQPAAQADGQWGGGSDANNKATADGKSFSALIAQLGGPPGKIEG